MRAAPLAAVLVLLSMPAAGAATAANGLSVSGPTSVSALEATTVPLLVSLTLRDVTCVRDASIPVDLSISQATGARAQLASERLHFRIAPHSTLARPWTGDAKTSALVEPTAARGLVEVLASYRLPSGCTALGGSTSGEARHTIRVEQAAASDVVSPLPVTGIFESSEREAPATPVGVQAAILCTALGAIAVLVKRVRERAA